MTIPTSADAARPSPLRSPIRRRFGSAVAAVLLAGVAFAAPARAETTGATVPTGTTLPGAPVIGSKVETFTLDNGLTVVVIPDTRAPVVTHMIWYKVGSSDEHPGKTGIAHYLEHLMFKGTKENPAGAFSKIVASVGGQENAFTSNDYTSYFQRVAKERLGLVMKLEADRMANLVLTDENARPELQVVLEERSMRTDNDPSALLAEQLDATMYPNNPYRVPVIGWRKEIEGLTYKDAIAFYDHWYTPNNAVLVVAGDVVPSEVKTLAEATYGKVPRRAEPGVRARPQDPEPIAAKTVTLADERVTQPNLRRAYLVPSARTAAKGESEALDVLAEIVGGGATSRLYRELVIDKGVASSAGAWYQSTAYDDSKLMVYATPRDGVSLDDLRAAIDATIADLVKNGVTDEELARAKKKLVAEAVRAQDNQASLARIFGAGLAIGMTVDEIRTWPSRVYAVDLAAVKAAAAKYLVAERSVTGYLQSAPPTGRKQAARAPFPTLGIGPSGPLRHGEDVSFAGLGVKTID